MAADPAFSKGELVDQVVQSLVERQFFQHGGAKLAQKLACGVVNTPREIVDLSSGLNGERRIARPLHQLRLNLDSGDVLANLIMKLARQQLAGVLFGMDQFLRQRPPGLKFHSQVDGDSVRGSSPDAAGG